MCEVSKTLLIHLWFSDLLEGSPKILLRFSASADKKFTVIVYLTAA